jgi:O-antigen/teichoic acid export membrane protein
MTAVAAQRPLAQTVARSAMTLFGRRVLISAMTVTGTAVIARSLGAASFGQLSAALAAYWLAAGASDFGFSLVLGRDLAAEPERRGRLLRASIQVQGAWSLVPALTLVGLGIASGLGTPRGTALAVLAIAIALGGFDSARAVFLALYRTRTLAAIDLATNALQLGAMLAVAALSGGVAGVAVAYTAVAVLNLAVMATVGLRLVDSGRPTAADRRILARRAAPLGLVSLMSSVYFSIDLVILGWLVSGRSLGHYAAACKVLTLLVTLPGLLMSASLPGLATTAREPEALAALAARIWHWLVAVGLPVCVAAGIFARPLVDVLFGGGYAGAVPLVRILSAAAAVALLTNILGTVLVARSLVRPLLAQNAAAIVLNVGGNLLLVPLYGVAAAAWLTLATEVFVCACALWTLRREMRVAHALLAGTRPAVAVAGFAATGIALTAWPAAAIPSATAVFLVLLVLLHAWPAELSPSRWRATGP